MKIMNAVMIILALSAFPPASEAQSQANKPQRQLELLKCVSPKIGTLWASFGRQRTLSGEIIATFPTEIVFFDLNGQMDRQTYPNISEGLLVPVTVKDNAIKMQFFTLVDGKLKTNVLGIMQFDWSDTHGFMGIWRVSNFEVLETNDKVFCTVH